MERATVIAILQNAQAELEALGVTHAYLFGSVATDHAGANSDIDVMVDLDEGPAGRKPLFSAFDIGGIQYKLTQMFGRPVDLVVRSDALRPGRRLKPIAERQLLDVF